MFTEQELMKLVAAGPAVIEAMRAKIETRLADPKFAGKRADYEAKLAQLARAAAAATALEG